MSGVYRLEQVIEVPHPLDEVFAFFSDARNLERLTPAWVRFHILTPQPIHMRVGTMIDYRLRIHGLPMRWRSEITTWDPPRLFVDEQRRGPYHRWRHEHRFEATQAGTRVIDRVEYQLRGGRLVGALVHGLFVKRDVARIFGYRATQLAALFGDVT